jgi:hypothetical protein
MVVKAECFYSIGTVEAYFLKVPALKLSHPSACPVFISASFVTGRIRGKG